VDLNDYNYPFTSIYIHIYRERERVRVRRAFLPLLALYFPILVLNDEAAGEGQREGRK